MINKLKQHKLILIIFIIGIILIVTGTTYSFYKIKLEGQKQHIVSSDVISFTYKESEDKIAITNMNPISDTQGKKNNYFEFKVSSKLKENMNIKYIVSLSKIDIENSFEDNDIKMYLTDGNDNELISPTIISLLEENKKIKDSKIIYANTFAYNQQEQTHTYRIRIWLKENVDMSKYTKVVETETGTNVTLEQKTYKFKINVNTIESMDTSGANKPILASNMIPVYYNEIDDVWKKADKDNSQKDYRWYSYESSGEYKGMWANAVTVKEANRQTYLNATPGTTISMGDINTMWVWIPRFNAVTPSNYNGGTKDNPGAIDVTFVKQNEPAIDAFTFGNKELSGFWYGKFEVSHTTLASSTTDNTLGCTNETCSNANGIIIKPNVTSLRNNNPSNFFFASRSMEQPNNSFGFVNIEVDTHMSKNNEWGAVAYLTHSIYGRCTSSTTCTEVYINNSSGMDTGRSGGNVGGSTPINGTYTDQTSTTQYNAYGFYTYDDYLLNYNTNTKGNKVKGKGTGASTTGTIYGIYDMSGGTAEYVMGVYSNTKGLSGFNSLPDEKYYNNYTESSYTYHALTETNGWYSDAAYFASKSYPWFKRGGYYGESKGGGVFNFSAQDGGRHNLLSSRFVITNE